MADYDDELLNDLRKINVEVVSLPAMPTAGNLSLITLQLNNPDDFESWEKLLRATENPDTPLNRNASPQTISAVRDVYDRFLARFPLFYGYWKKYADLEFSIAGTESAEYVRTTVFPPLSTLTIVDL